MKKTKWFNGKKIVPAYSGVYEVAPSGRTPRFQYWNGKFWGLFCTYIESAVLTQYQKSCMQNSQWRGLAEDPNKSTQQRKS